MDAEQGGEDLPPEQFTRLLAEVRKGSHGAFGLLIQWKRRQCERFIARRIDPALQSKDAVSDIYQDAMIEAWRDFHQFRGASEGEFYGFLQSIIANTIRDSRRRFTDTQKRDVGREIRLRDDDGSSPGFEPAASARQPDRSAELHEEQRLLAAEIERLPDDYRAAWTLYFEENLSFVEIGNRMGRSGEAARKLFHRGFAILRERMNGGRGADPPESPGHR
ncbi:MAG: sigma-70 family RNA polymerase sigma factor [Planctomycetes bacterium]|nr:sigma-70 family RNA polymerase sigma factor [Planctomycetota bacterium]